MRRRTRRRRGPACSAPRTSATKAASAASWGRAEGAVRAQRNPLVLFPPGNLSQGGPAHPHLFSRRPFPVSRKPLANGLLSILSCVICGDRGGGDRSGCGSSSRAWGTQRSAAARPKGSPERDTWYPPLLGWEGGSQKARRGRPPGQRESDRVSPPSKTLRHNPSTCTHRPKAVHGTAVS